MRYIERSILRSILNIVLSKISCYSIYVISRELMFIFARMSVVKI